MTALAGWYLSAVLKQYVGVPEEPLAARLLAHAARTPNTVAYRIASRRLRLSSN